MEIPNEIIKKWKELKEEGDIAALAKKLGKAESTVHQIFRTGIAHVRDAAIINSFYKERKKQIKSIKLEDDSN